MLKKLKNLDLFLIDTKSPGPKETDLVEKAFRLWQTSWHETFKNQNVDIGKTLYSDDFLSRKVIALVNQEEPIALFFESWFSIKNSHLNHSYFKNYPKQVLTKLEKLGIKDFMTLSYMTIRPDWRKKHTDLPISELLFSLGVKTFEKNNFDYLVGYIRKDNDFNEVFYRHGGIKISESNVYNSGVDYAYMTQESKRLSPIPGVADAADYLWSKMENRSRQLKIAA